jgi:hypothetical protein
MGKLIERDQAAIGQLGELILPGLANIDEVNGMTVGQLLGQVTRGDFQGHDGTLSKACLVKKGEELPGPERCRPGSSG